MTSGEIVLTFPATCAVCGAPVVLGTRVWWDVDSSDISHLGCHASVVAQAVADLAPPPDVLEEEPHWADEADELDVTVPVDDTVPVAVIPFAPPAPAPALDAPLAFAPPVTATPADEGEPPVAEEPDAAAQPADEDQPADEQEPTAEVDATVDDTDATVDDSVDGDVAVASDPWAPPTVPPVIPAAAADTEPAVDTTPPPPAPRVSPTLTAPPRARDEVAHRRSRLPRRAASTWAPASALALGIGRPVAVLDHRLTPQTGRVIDHVIVAGSGVWVMTVKTSTGRVEKRESRSLFTHHDELVVDGVARPRAVRALRERVAAVRTLVDGLGEGWDRVPVRGLLCFTDADWKPFATPFEVGGVIVVWPKQLNVVLHAEQHVPPHLVDGVAERLLAALPSATDRPAARRSLPGRPAA